MSNIKRAVSLYSYQDEYARGKMTLEDCFAKLDDLGVEGVEIISDQMLPNSPFIADETLKNWKRITEKYKVKPICNDIFINTKLYKNRFLTKKENLELLINEIKNANKLGIKLIRLVSMTPTDIIEEALSYAEKYDVCLALEVHGGMSFNNPWTKAFTDIMFRVNSPYLGLVPDLGIFCRRHPRVSRNYFLSIGLNPELADYIDSVFAEGKCFNRDILGYGHEMPPHVKAMIKSGIDFQYCIFAGGYENSDISILDPYMPYVKHIHGKIYEITEEGEEYSIPYGEIIKYLKEKGYNGYIATEYEGNRFTLAGKDVIAISQVEKHQAMLKRYIEE